MLRGKDQTEREIQHQQVRGVVYDDQSKCCRGRQGCFSPYGCGRNFVCECHAKVEWVNR